MASNYHQVPVALAVAAVLFATIAMGAEYIVGDDEGWTINFDYQAWAKDKVFHVGDKLVFKYTAPDHNVFKVNGTAFKDCIAPPSNERLSSGNDEIVLATPGNRWYICGVSGHCDAGQKLAITVWDPQTPPSSAVRGISFSGYQVFFAAIAFLVIITV
ncbi:hypothetical protein FNV43_RR15352 [Rhamnella rubrinervis]|uniref:Phytocyanin domain-containing protein n=1 Tax=Rhamnella rubrinervis TaxID=2594499 RepID=A0A8K0E7M0_9ROSA|nr:hypothetical protein FNV43_RR15352 [Rhamnella rubrinervis]